MKFSRRTFLGMTAATAAARLNAAPAWMVDGIPLPEWAVAAIREGTARYRAWKGADETVAFPLITDIHSHAPGFNAETPNWRDSKSHVIFQRAIAHATGSDFLANLGDMDFDVNILGSAPEWDKVQPVIDGFVKVYEKEPLPTLFSMGNHDHARGRYTSKQFGDTFNRGVNKGKGHNIVLSACATWGYYDIPAKNFRIIFLNSQGTGTQGGCYYIFDEAQLDWLQGVLDATPDDMTVIVTAHYMPHPMGRWTIGNTSQHNLGLNEKLMGMLSAFKARGASLAGMICGDTHANYYTEYNGVNYFISQGYGWVVPDLMLPGQTHAFFKYQDNLCIDVVAVKPSAREVHTFRIGAGGADFDICFRY